MAAKPQTSRVLRALASAALTAAAYSLIGLPLLAVLLSTSPYSFSLEQWGLLLSAMLIGGLFSYREGPIHGFTSALATTFVIGGIRLFPGLNSKEDSAVILVLLVATFIGVISAWRALYWSVLAVLALLVTSFSITISALLLSIVVGLMAKGLGLLLKYWLSPLQSTTNEAPYFISFGVAGLLFVTIFSLLYDFAYLIQPEIAFVSVLPNTQAEKLKFFDFFYFSVCTALPGSAHIAAASPITQGIAAAELLLSPALLVIYFSLLMRRISAVPAETEKSYENASKTY